MKKLIAALVSRFSRRTDAEPDQFEKRLQSLTAPTRRAARPYVAPHLFRREVGHA